MSKSVLCEEKDNICLITLNEEDTRNAISPEIIKELVSILEEIDNNKNISCAILTGAGKSFSSGGNLHEINEMTENNNMSLRDIENWYRNGIQRIPMTFNKIDVPVIAAVNGHAIGAGNDLCTMCDIRIASENAKFSESFLRIGIIPGDGGSWFLPKIIGLSRATEMILTCEVLDAQKALDWGLVSHVVPQEELLNKALLNRLLGIEVGVQKRKRTIIKRKRSF